jgi:hypothetical protein
MGVEHLQGKRTGRPRGSKSTPHWVRALRWAERNLDNPAATPPSPLAAKLLGLGREQPDKFLACLALRDAREQTPAPVPGAAAPDERTAKLGGDQPRRVKMLVIPMAHLVMQLHGDGPIPWVRNLPRDVQLWGFAVKTVGTDWRGWPERALRITLYSPSFPEVAPGAPIPELVPEFSTRR